MNCTEFLKLHPSIYPYIQNGEVRRGERIHDEQKKIHWNISYIYQRATKNDLLCRLKQYRRGQIAGFRGFKVVFEIWWQWWRWMDKPTTNPTTIDEISEKIFYLMGYALVLWSEYSIFVEWKIKTIRETRS